MKNENYFCHLIIPSKNLQRSKTFFEKVFGWIVQALPGESYWDVLPPSKKGISAELNSEAETIVPSINTEDIDAKLKLIEACGGIILEGKTPAGENGEYGYYALFEDPEGNKMCFYSEK